MSGTGSTGEGANRVPEERIRSLGARPLRRGGRYVLYWMITARRTRANFGLQRAAELASELEKPLVVLEPISASYRWASARFHRFLLDGMRANQDDLAGAAVLYHPYVEPARGAARELLAAFSAEACAVVTDDFPCFEVPRWLERAAERCAVRLEAVDSNGIVPMRSTPKAFATAHAFRRHLQQVLPAFLQHGPAPEPLAGLELPRLARLPARLTAAFPRAAEDLLARDGAGLARLPIDASVGVVESVGGAAEAGRRLTRFLKQRLAGYAELRNQPDEDRTSALSAHLHFGHLGAHEVLSALLAKERRRIHDLEPGGVGARSGWWGMGTDAEAFVDQLVTWRELGFNQCVHQPRYAELASLPAFAQRTLAEHALDPRPEVYGLPEFEAARTHDPLWNAAQRQLLTEGRIHNYLRMLWGKKILHWSRSPAAALAILVHLNDKYALDGRDPNSYTNILWILGRHDRAWGPERPVFGKVRYMSSANTARKLRLKGYLARYGADAPRADLPALSSRPTRG